MQPSCALIKNATLTIKSAIRDRERKDFGVLNSVAT